MVRSVALCTRFPDQTMTIAQETCRRLCTSLHLLSLHVTAPKWHCMSLHLLVTACHGMSLHATRCHCTCIYHCISLHMHVTAYHFTCMSLHAPALHCMSLHLHVTACSDMQCVLLVILSAVITYLK